MSILLLRVGRRQRAVSAAVFADDKTPWDITPAEQTQMKREADTKKAAAASETSEEKAAARKARDAQAQKYQDTTIKITQNPWESSNMSINRSAAASKAGPSPPRGTIDTPEVEKLFAEAEGP